MSKARLAPQVAIDWSPTQVSWVSENGELVTASSLSEAASLLPSRDVLVAFSRRSAFIRAYRVPNAGKEEVRRIVAMQLGQLFPVPADEVSFDLHLTEDVTSEGRLAVICAMRSSDLTDMREQAAKAGIRIVRVVPAAIGAAMLAKSVNMPDCAVVQRSAEGLSIDLVVGGDLRYSRVAPMPASAIGIDAEVGRTFAAAALSCAPTLAAGGLILADAESNTPVWSLQALLRGPLDIDVQTPDQVQTAQKKAEGRRMRMSLLLLAAALLLAVAYYLNWADAQQLANRGDGKWQAQLRKLRLIRDEESNKNTALSVLKTALDQGFHPAQGMSDVVTIASNSVPQGVWLTGFSLERGKALTIRGTATKGEAVAQYQDALVNDPRFRDVKLVFANNAEINNTPVVQFSIQAFPVGNLPLVEAKKKGAVKK